MTEQANRNYRDSVFTKYFRENPQGLVELYNAIAGTDYPLDTPVVPNSLEDVLYKEKMNDLSFVLDNQILVLIEHQSTINENMALRLLMYVARLYEKLLNQWDKRAVYEERRIPIPTPKFVVLYNGEDPYPEHTVQQLSKSFMVQDEEPVLELKADVYNINYREESAFLQKSRYLTSYSLFVHIVQQEQAAGKTREEAIRSAITQCIRQDIMREFLEEHGSEVYNMLLREWKLEEALKYKEQKGREEERKKMIRKFSKINTPEQIAEIVNEPVEYVLKVINEPMYVSEEETPYIAEKRE